jgi:hypothetical protein
MPEVYLHVAWIDPGTVHPEGLKRMVIDTSTLLSPWVIQVVFSSLNQQDL